MNGPRLSISRINDMEHDAFVGAFGPLFEGSPWIASQTWEKRPFKSIDDLHRHLCATMHGAGPVLQVALIEAHPDLVGRAALAGTLTPQSTAEQSAAGLDRLSAEEVAEFTRLNAAYRDKFDFPFVICARENKKESILSGFTTRLHNTREQEIDTALAEIAKIARLRLQEVASDDRRPATVRGPKGTPLIDRRSET